FDGSVTTTMEYPVAVQCGGAGQLCDKKFSVRFDGGGQTGAVFKTLETHCSTIFSLSRAMKKEWKPTATWVPAEATRSIFRRARARMCSRFRRREWRADAIEARSRAGRGAFTSSTGRS